MKERLVQLLDLEQLTPSKFAELIGVQRSSVSHVVSGRNKPSFDFIQKTLKAFPGLNAEWLIMGKGAMYEQMGRRSTGTLFDAPAPPDEEMEEPDGQAEADEAVDRTPPDHPDEGRSGASELLPGDGTATVESGLKDREKRAANQPAGKPARRIARVILLYDDDTFTSFEPS